LLSIGILTRGGLSKGLLHHSDKAVFGPAFLSAYEMENQTAIFPRIIVDRETLKDYSALDDIGDAFRAELKFSDDGPVFINTLSMFARPDRSTVFAVMAEKCQKVIQEKLFDSVHQPKHYSKLKWLAIHWNATRANQPHIDGAGPVAFPGFGSRSDNVG
jgi:hypothetical protein